MPNELASIAPPDAPAYDLESWRRQIPILDTFIPLNNCSQAPQTDRTRTAAEAYLSSWQTDGMDWETWMEEVYLAKVEFARLINAMPDEIAITTSVSAATASIASALDLSGPRNKVVATEAEFPTVGHVWLAHQKYGLALDWMPLREGIIDLEAYDAHIDEQTLIVSACHGYYQNGFKQDLAAIAAKTHAHGAWLYVDAYQTLGTCPIDVKALDIDFLSSGVLKFCMGVPGIAFLYVKPDLLDRLHPAVTGWFGRANPFAFDTQTLDWAPTASRFDTGTPAVINAYIARAGLSILNEIGLDYIQAWTDHLSHRLITGGQERGLTLHGTTDYRQKAPTTAFICPSDSHTVEMQMRERGIIGSARGPVIRLAPHFYNTVAEIDTALDALADIL